MATVEGFVPDAEASVEDFVPDFQPDAPEPAKPAGSWFKENVSVPASKVVKLAGQYTPIDALQAGASKLFGGAVSMPTPTSSDETAETAAKLLVPQSGTEAGIMAGTLGAGPLVSKLAPPAVTLGTRLIGPALRIGASTAGGAAGGALSGEGAGQGGAQGALSSLGGEAFSTAAGKLVRSLPGMAAKISNDTAREVARTLGKQVPALAKYGDDLYTMAMQGKQELSNMFEDAVTKVGSLTGPLQISLSKSPISVKGAHDLMTKITDPLARQLAKDEISAAIRQADPSGVATQLWDQAFGQYKSGANILKALSKKSLWDGNQLKLPALQQDLSNPGVAGKLIKKMGSGFNDLVEAATRGGGIGAKDKVASIAPTSLRGMIGGGIGQAAGGPLAWLAPILSPNILTRYAGRVPYAVGPAGRIGATVAAEKALEADSGR